jgi:integral membrane protein
MFSSFRLLSLLEGCSLIVLLFIAMPAKYQFGMGAIVPVTGSIHGMLFLIYLVMSLMVSHQREWSIAKWLAVFIAGTVPFGFVLVERQLRRELEPVSA